MNEDASLAIRWEIDGEQLDAIEEHAEGPHTLPEKLLASLAESELIRQRFFSEDEDR